MSAAFSLKREQTSTHPSRSIITWHGPDYRIGQKPWNVCRTGSDMERQGRHKKQINTQIWFSCKSGHLDVFQNSDNRDPTIQDAGNCSSLMAAMSYGLIQKGHMKVMKYEMSFNDNNRIIGKLDSKSRNRTAGLNRSSIIELPPQFFSWKSNTVSYPFC